MAEGKDIATDDKISSQFKPFTAEYDDFEEQAIKLTFHFKKPGRKQLVSLSKADKSKQFDTMSKVLGQLVDPSERNSLDTELKKEPMLVAAYADAIMRRCGGGSVELGN
ncbi:hypothetical protein [Maridesulfovibrio bastinii]|uniref:hypothetical protein n=1 Tax=Maridesulfovibrio bastinii TaxID=47157 RepID=UPI0004083930|nr:hypothetical protein [Maridesulfovibrio bastinii]